MLWITVIFSSLREQQPLFFPKRFKQQKWLTAFPMVFGLPVGELFRRSVERVERSRDPAERAFALDFQGRMDDGCVWGDFFFPYYF